MKDQAVKLIVTFCLPLVLLGCIADPDEESNPTKVIFVLANTSYDMTIYLDGNSIGSLNASNARIEKTLGAGGHSYRVHDNRLGLDSKTQSFSIAEGQILTVTLGGGGSGCGDWVIPAPTSLAASDGTYVDHIHLSWSCDLPSSTVYEISRRPSTSSTFTVINTVVGKQYDDYDVSSSATFYYRVRVVYANCSGPYSAENSVYLRR